MATVQSTERGAKLVSRTFKVGRLEKLVLSRSNFKKLTFQGFFCGLITAYIER